MSKAYVHQDGGDFYIYLDKDCEFLATTWSVHFVVGLSLGNAFLKQIRNGRLNGLIRSHKVLAA